MSEHICSEHLVCTLGCDTSVARLMHELGHMDKIDADGFSIYHPTWDEVCELTANDARLRDGVASWQRFRPWLKEDGEFGEVSHMASQQEVANRCGCPDLMRRPGGNLPRWGDPCFKGITTAFDDARMRHDLGGKTPTEVWDEGNAIINAACGAVLSRVAMSDDPMIRAIMGAMGSGTLAWSYLISSGCSDRLRQEYNRARTWGYHSFLWVNVHEKGHALGLPHTGKSGNIMQPYYSSGLSRLGTWDTEQFAKRYGPPVAVPEPPPPPGPEPEPGKPAYGLLRYYDEEGLEVEKERWTLNRRATVPGGK